MSSGHSEWFDERKYYGAHSQPAKIDMLNDTQRRRDSLIEKQLNDTLIRQTMSYEQPQMQQQVYGQQSRGFESTQPGSSTTTTDSYTTREPINGQRYGTQTVTTTTKTVTSNLNAHNQQQMPQYTQQQQQQHQRPQRTIDPIAALEETQAKLRREIAYMNQYQNHWMKPVQIREPRKESPARASRSDHRWLKECPSGPSSRPTSRASSTRSTTELDLLEKTDKLLQDVEELERKPLNKQQILIETAGNRPIVRPLSEPSEEQVSSVHMAVIKEPIRNIDNKSPLPFAFDNFSTLGVRGNIASFGAAEPDTPYPPIFPVVKRTPSPTKRK